MKLTDFVTITEQRNTFGKKRGYLAKIGNFEAEGAKPDIAVNNLKSKLEYISQNFFKAKVFKTKNPDIVVVVKFGIGGWEYSFYSLVSNKESGTCLFGADFDFEKACAAASKHAEDYF